MVLISHFGHPIEAAVDAAPILREWDVMLAAPLVVCNNRVLRSFRVRYFLLWYVNNGPEPVGWI